MEEKVSLARLRRNEVVERKNLLRDAKKKRDAAILKHLDETEDIWFRMDEEQQAALKEIIWPKLRALNRKPPAKIIDREIRGMLDRDLHLLRACRERLLEHHVLPSFGRLDGEVIMQAVRLYYTKLDDTIPYYTIPCYTIRDNTIPYDTILS